ncbi:MAG: hypothetical protein CGW95_10605 [Phenylobacterium zucineum]|nr:MAG: hypothetical protein CGW95_10605 [Phenylobacterium zucineum]
MWLRDVPGPRDRHQAGPQELLESFDQWLSERLSDARRRGKNLAFSDAELHREDNGRWDGWDFIYFDPEDPPELDEQWTVYRLFPLSDWGQPCEG